MKNLLIIIGLLLSFSSISQTMLYSTEQQYLTNDSIDFYGDDYIKFIIHKEKAKIYLIRVSETIEFDIVNDTIKNGVVSLYCLNQDKKKVIIDLFFNLVESIEQINVFTMKENTSDLIQIRFLTKEFDK